MAVMNIARKDRCKKARVLLRPCYGLTLQTEAQRHKVHWEGGWLCTPRMTNSVSKRRVKYSTPTRKPEFNVKQLFRIIQGHAVGDH